MTYNLIVFGVSKLKGPKQNRKQSAKVTYKLHYLATVNFKYK